MHEYPQQPSLFEYVERQWSTRREYSCPWTFSAVCFAQRVELRALDSPTTAGSTTPPPRACRAHRCARRGYARPRTLCDVCCAQRVELRALESPITACSNSAQPYQGPQVLHGPTTPTLCINVEKLCDRRATGLAAVRENLGQRRKREIAVLFDPFAKVILEGDR